MRKQELIYGVNSVGSALDTGRSIDKILVSKSGQSNRISRIISAARKRKITVQFVPSEAITRKASTSKHQGIIAYVGSVPTLELNQMLKTWSSKDQFHMVAMLDGIEDPHNLGAIARSAEAAGVSGLIVPSHRSAPISAVADKSSAGAISYLPLARVTNLSRTVEVLKKKGYWIVGCDESSKNTLWDFEFKFPVVIIVGNEGKGIQRIVKEKCDDLVSIPMFGKIASLNASVAAGLFFYECRRFMEKKTMSL